MHDWGVHIWVGQVEASVTAQTLDPLQTGHEQVRFTCLVVIMVSNKMLLCDSVVSVSSDIDPQTLLMA